MTTNSQFDALGQEQDGSSTCFEGSDLTRRIEDSLHETGYSHLRNLHWCVVEGVVTLRGRLPSYFAKQLAQSAVARVMGVDRVVNEIEVAKLSR